MTRKDGEIALQTETLKGVLNGTPGSSALTKPRANRTGSDQRQPLHVPFNRPYHAGNESVYLNEAIRSSQLCGGGTFANRCRHWMEFELGVKRPLLTHSCTHALEIAAILSEVGPGDEVIIPSFTFTSTANAFVLRGATPVFVDIRKDTLNLDETLLEEAITPATRAIVPVHYAGVSCEMDSIMEIADAYRLMVIEDAAHAFLSRYKGRPLGTIGRFGTFSFHETKGIHCGEGGALLANDSSTLDLIDILAEKGTNRQAFINGQVDKYSWVHMGSSYLPGELPMAFLYAQFEKAIAATNERIRMWNQYHAAFEGLEAQGMVQRPHIPTEADHNAHLYYLVLNDSAARDRALRKLRALGIDACFHYIPLHTAIAGLRYGRTHGPLSQTTDLSSRLIRLPLWMNMRQGYVDRVIESTRSVLSSR